MQILGLSFARKAIRELGALLCKAIYSLIALLYEVFDTISRANILKSEEIEPLYQRVTLVLTIVMVFYITFEFVKYVVQPDTINDKEKGAGNLVLKLVTVILLIAFVPTIFDMAFKLQERLLDSQIFSKVILGKENVNMTSFGKSFSATMFGMFYDVNDEACKTYDSDKDSCSAAPIVKYNLGWLENQGNLKNLSVGLNDSESKTYDMGNGNTKTEDVPLIKFDGIQAIVVGGLIVYILVLYCVDLGTRYAQLVFLQIMSPIAIMGHLSPKKDNMFSKWIKQCITTYLDLFIRLFIIYFILLICDVLQTAYKGDKLFVNINVSTSTKVFAYIAIILGLLVFAQKAPKMLKELLPNMGGEAGIGFGLSAKNRGLDKVAGATIGAAAGVLAGGVSGLRQGARGFKSGGPLAKRIASGIGNSLAGAVGGVVGGGARGLTKGYKQGNPLKNGFAGAKSQIKANKRFGNMVENDYNILHQAQDKLGVHTRKEVAEAQKAVIQRHKEALSKITKANDDMRARAEKKIREEGKGGAAGSEFLAKEKIARDFKEDPSVKAQYTAEKYGSAEAAEKAFADAYQKALEAAKKAKDKAIESYINEAAVINAEGKQNDPAIVSMRNLLETEIKEYNKYNKDRPINDKIPTDAKALDDYTKKDVKQMQDKDDQDIIGLNAKIEAINRETAGSSNNK